MADLARCAVGLLFSRTSSFRTLFILDFYETYFSFALFLVYFSALPASLAQAENTHVLIKTNQGDIVIELENDKAPISVDNF